MNLSSQNLIRAISLLRLLRDEGLPDDLSLSIDYSQSILEKEILPKHYTHKRFNPFPEPINHLSYKQVQINLKDRYQFNESEYSSSILNFLHVWFELGKSFPQKTMNGQQSVMNIVYRESDNENLKSIDISKFSKQKKIRLSKLSHFFESADISKKKKDEPSPIASLFRKKDAGLVFRLDRSAFLHQMDFENVTKGLVQLLERGKGKILDVIIMNYQFSEEDLNNLLDQLFRMWLELELPPSSFSSRYDPHVELKAFCDYLWQKTSIFASSTYTLKITDIPRSNEVPIFFILCYLEHKKVIQLFDYGKFCLSQVARTNKYEVECWSVECSGEFVLNINKKVLKNMIDKDLKEFPSVPLSDPEDGAIPSDAIILNNNPKRLYDRTQGILFEKGVPILHFEPRDNKLFGIILDGMTNENSTSFVSRKEIENEMNWMGVSAQKRINALQNQLKKVFGWKEVLCNSKNTGNSRTFWFSPIVFSMFTEVVPREEIGENSEKIE